MTCPSCAPLASRILALEEELRAYKAIVDGHPQEQAARLLAVELGVTKRCAALVHRLWLAQGRRVAAGVLADGQWPDADPTAARNSLKAAVLHVRDALGVSAIITDDGGYRLDAELVARVGRALVPPLLPQDEPGAPLAHSPASGAACAPPTTQCESPACSKPPRRRAAGTGRPATSRSGGRPQG